MDNISENVENIMILLDHVPKQMNERITAFCESLVETHQEHILSINIVGSVVTPDFFTNDSDLNLLFVYSDFELDYFKLIIPTLLSYWKRYTIAPRIISKRNLISSAEYFPIDFWSMQQQHILLYGEDVLLDINIEPKDLLWQFHHQVKGMRMRFKQQYWQHSLNGTRSKKLLITYFNNILLLVKVLMHLKSYPIPKGTDELFDEISKLLFIDLQELQVLYHLKKGTYALNKDNILHTYEIVFKMIKNLDELSETLKC